MTLSPIPHPLVYKTGVWYKWVTLHDTLPHTPPTWVQDRHMIQVSYPTWHYTHTPPTLCKWQACDTSELPYMTLSPIPHPLVYKTGVWYKLITLHDTIPHTPPTLCTWQACDTSELPNMTLSPNPHPLVYKTDIWYKWVTLHDTIPHTPPTLCTWQACDTSELPYMTHSPIPHPLVYKTGVWYKLVTLHDTIPHTPPTLCTRQTYEQFHTLIENVLHVVN